MSRVTNLEGGKNGALNRGEVIRLQTGGNVPAFEENSVSPAERNAGKHVTLGPHVPLRVKEWIGSHGNKVMEGFNWIRGNGAERNDQAQAGMVATARDMTTTYRFTISGG